MNNYTKNWAFTWQTTITLKNLPDVEKFRLFLNNIAEDGVFQLEKGKIANKYHYQGYFTVMGPRRSKKDVLKYFEREFGTVSGLTLSKIYDKNAILAYATKEDTRVSGPYYIGLGQITTEIYATYSTMKLKSWQEDLYKLMCDVRFEKRSDYKTFQDRYIIWVSDPEGGSGKSDFIKWLTIGQKKLQVVKLPIDSVDRLTSSVVSVTKKKRVDAFVIDDTRTKGKDTSFEDMFEAIETIKNGHVVSCMYGKYLESIFLRPIIIFFTNRELEKYSEKLSLDRWYPMKIEKDEIFATNIHGADQRYIERLRKSLLFNNSISFDTIDESSDKSKKSEKKTKKKGDEKRAAIDTNSPSELKKKNLDDADDEIIPKNDN